MKPKEKGDIAVAHAIFYFQMNGYEVCLPMGDKRPYDLVVEFGGKLFKVQVKYGGLYKSASKHTVALRTMGGNQTFYTAKHYNDGDFDLLFAYLQNGRKFLLPWSAAKDRSSLSIEAGKYASYEVK